jgi:hypothetical protein
MMTSFVTWRVGTTPYPDADLYFTKRANSWKSQNSLALWFSCDGFCYNFANIATHVWRLSSNGMPLSTNCNYWCPSSARDHHCRSAPCRKSRLLWLLSKRLFRQEPERNNRAADPVHLRAITRLQPMRRRAPKFIQD